MLEVYYQPPLFVATESIPPKTHKICPRCTPPVEKPLDEFYLRRDRSDGRGTYCKACYAKESHANLDRRRNREQSKGEKFKKAKYAAHKEWRKKNREEIRVQDRVKYATNPVHAARMRRHTVKWIKAHPLIMQEHQLRRIAQIKKSQTEPVNLESVLERHGRWCYICEQEILPTQSLVFDHVIPLIPRKGDPKGDHSESNLRPAHRQCNGRKSNRRFEDLTPFDRRGVI